MTDLIRTLESDLFGAYEWSALAYEDLRGVPEAPERLAVFRGLMRAYEHLEGRADDSMRAADGMVAAEAELDDVERALLAPLDAARDALFEDASPEKARAFLAVFDPAWARAKSQTLVSDAILAALSRSNLIAGREKARLPAAELAALHAEAAKLYEDVNALLQFRVGAGSLDWSETAQSALFRAAAAWRLAGNEERSGRARAIAGEPKRLG